MAKRRVLVLGLPYFGRMLAGVLVRRGWDATFLGHPGRSVRGWLRVARALLRADVLYLISARVDRRAPQAWLLRFRRRPTVIHWVGTDVLIALEAYERGDVPAHIARAAVHWCDAPWLAPELSQLGIAAEYVPLPVPGVATAEPTPLPERFHVLLYLPEDDFDREVFDMETLLALPNAFPEVQFTLVPSRPETLPGPLPPNLSAPGWVEDMEALYRDVTVMVRLTSHDGTSFMAVECLARGRYVIWTYPFEGVTQASGFEAVRSELAELIERHQRGELRLNEVGIQHARTAFDPVRLEDEIHNRLRRLRPRGKRRIH